MEQHIKKTKTERIPELGERTKLVVCDHKVKYFSCFGVFESYANCSEKECTLRSSMSDDDKKKMLDSYLMNYGNTGTRFAHCYHCNGSGAKKIFL